jgi:hypothetical protein
MKPPPAESDSQLIQIQRQTIPIDSLQKLLQQRIQILQRHTNLFWYNSAPSVQDYSPCTLSHRPAIPAWAEAAGERYRRGRRDDVRSWGVSIKGARKGHCFFAVGGTVTGHCGTGVLIPGSRVRDSWPAFLNPQTSSCIPGFPLFIL